MRIANLISQQSYAEDRKVGAIIVKDDNIISFSYNGKPLDESQQRIQA